MANILVVDDSETVRVQLRKDLQSKGHTVVEAVDGVDGLSKLGASPGIQVIIADMNMPNMDGIEMCTKIHADVKYKTIKIFMLTTEARASMKLKGMDAGVIAWIVKPYISEKLLAAIDKVLLR